MSEQTTPDEQEPVDEEEDLTLDNLQTTESALTLGTSAVSMLQSFGSATFYVDESGYVRIANPLNVVLRDKISHPPEGVEPEFVRPLLSDGRPSFVAIRDGVLWEVSYPKHEDLSEDNVD